MKKFIIFIFAILFLNQFFTNVASAQVIPPYVQPSCGELVRIETASPTHLLAGASGCNYYSDSELELLKDSIQAGPDRIIGTRDDRPRPTITSDIEYFLQVRDSDNNHLFNISLSRVGDTDIARNTSPFTMYRVGTFTASLYGIDRTNSANGEVYLNKVIIFEVTEEDIALAPDRLGDQEPPPAIQLCLADNGSSQGFPTPFGCVPFDDPNVYTIAFVSVGIALAGLIALVLMSISAFMIMTSSGEPRRMQQGKELLTSAVIGLVMITLSVLIMRILGGSLLGLF